MLCISNNSIKHQSFVYTQLNNQRVQNHIQDTRCGGVLSLCRDAVGILYCDWAFVVCEMGNKCPFSSYFVGFCFQHAASSCSSYEAFPPDASLRSILFNYSDTAADLNNSILFYKRDHDMDFGKCRVPFYCHRSQVHSDPE